MNDKTDRLIDETEKAVAKLLATLEANTGMVLDSIRVVDVEITNLSDTREQWARRVRIEMKRLPGTNWGQ